VTAGEPGTGGYEGRQAAQVRIEELHNALLKGARTDLGLAWACRCRRAVSWPGSLAGLLYELTQLVETQYSNLLVFV
jgi:hypothetical protein